MELKAQRGAQALLPGHVRLSGEISYGAPGTPSEVLWFEFPAEFAAGQLHTGNHWLLALLPLAVQLGEPLRLSAPVDPILLRGADEIMRVWSRWVPRWKPVPIESPIASESASRRRAGGTGLFFTGGVDSFFTVLRYDEEAAARPGLGRAPINDLIYVWGYDIPLANPEAFARKRRKLEELAVALGKRLILLATNTRETRLRSVDWAFIGHGPALGAAGLLLEHRFQTLLLSGSAAYDCPKPLGSHPFIDPRMSTSGMRFLHYGAGFTRTEKVAWLSRHDLALRNLQVCWRGGTDTNCGRCEKCYRTQLALEICGVRDRAASFPPDLFQLKNVRYLRTPSPAGAYILENMIPIVRARNRPDILRLLRAALTRDRRLKFVERTVSNVRHVPVLGSAARTVMRALNHRTIT